MQPRYRNGDEVRLLYDIVGDGTVHDVSRGAPLMTAGATGFVKHCGPFLDDLVCDVHFLEADRIVGCREKELIPADHPWSPPVYLRSQPVVAAVELASQGVTLAKQGTPGKVTAVRFVEGKGYVYEVAFDGADTLALVFERQLKERS